MDQTAQPDQSGRQRRFTGAEAGPLDLDTAAAWTAAERRQHPDEVHGYFFGRQILERILAQPDCMGLRVYYATDPATNQRHLLVVGADAHQNDQLPAPPHRPADPASPPPTPTPRAARTVTGLIAEMASPCPDMCGKPNPLNGGKQ